MAGDVCAESNYGEKVGGSMNHHESVCRDGGMSLIEVQHVRNVNQRGVSNENNGAIHAKEIQSTLRSMFLHASERTLREAAEIGDLNLAIDWVLAADDMSLREEAVGPTMASQATLPSGGEAMRELMLEEESDESLEEEEEEEEEEGEDEEDIDNVQDGEEKLEEHGNCRCASARVCDEEDLKTRRFECNGKPLEICLGTASSNTKVQYTPISNVAESGYETTPVGFNAVEDAVGASIVELKATETDDFQSKLEELHQTVDPASSLNGRSFDGIRASRAEWIALPNSGSCHNAMQFRMPSHDLGECRRLCEEHGFCGFVTYMGYCYFRGGTAEDILSNLAPSQGGCLHLFAPHPYRQHLYNSGVPSNCWRPAISPTKDFNGHVWQDLQSEVLNGFKPAGRARVSKLGLLRRLRISPCEGVDCEELVNCLNNVFTHLDVISQDLIRRREVLLCLEEDAGTSVPVRHACGALDEALAAAALLQQSALEWKAEAHSAIANAGLSGNTLRGELPVPLLNFGDIADFLEECLSLEDGISCKSRVFDLVKQCAVEEARKKIDRSAVELLTDALRPEARVDFPLVTELCERMSDRPAELAGTVGLLTSVLMCPSSDARTMLKALTIMHEIIDWDTRAASAFSNVRGAHEALIELKGMRNAAIGDAVAADIRMFATEIEKKCFASDECDSSSPRRRIAAAVVRRSFMQAPSIAGVDDGLYPDGAAAVDLRDFPIGATFVAVDCLQMRQGERLDTPKVNRMPAGSLCRVLEHGGDRSGRRLLVDWAGCVGWVSYKTEDGEALLNQKWRCEEFIKALREPILRPRRKASRLHTWPASWRTRAEAMSP